MVRPGLMVKHGFIDVRSTHGMDLDSWYGQVPMAKTWTHSIDKKSWYRYGHMLLLITHDINLDSWYIISTLESHTYKRVKCS